LANAPAETKDQFITAMTKKLADLDAKVAELAQKSEGLKDDAKVQADQALAALRGQRETAKQKFDQAKLATNDAWKDFKAGVEVAMNQLETAYENAKSKFN
jgi:DNA repair exonuclease SbcCD ATPase subunit